MTDLIISELEKCGITCSYVHAKKLDVYMNGIIEMNKHVNLTNITDPKEFIIKHYVDSLALREFDEYINAHTIIDIGTGAGFPGIPLAVMDEDKDIVLLETLGKRVRIIRELTEKAGINNVTVIKARAEDAGRDEEYREKFDLAVSRAVADMAVLSEYCLPFVKVGGYFAAYKTGNEEEINGAKKAIEMLGGKIKRVVDSGAPGMDHDFVMVEKFTQTSSKYPRQAGKPAKQPLR